MKSFVLRFWKRYIFNDVCVFESLESTRKEELGNVKAKAESKCPDFTALAHSWT